MFGTKKGWPDRNGLFSDRSLAVALVRRADAARDDRRFAAAAALYEEAIRLGRNTPGVHVQAGHMHKEAGNLAAAEGHYLTAAQTLSDDADLALQLGHFYRSSGRLREAERAYRKASSLKPDWAEPQTHLKHMREWGWRAAGEDAAQTAVSFVGLDDDTEALTRAATFDRVVPELIPLPTEQTFHRHGESIHFRRLGHPERTYWGVQTTLRGVEAIRGFCLSRDPIVELQILLNGQVVNRGPLKAFPLRNEAEDPSLLKYVFNVWIDFSRHLPGRYELALRFRDIRDTPDPDGGRRFHRQHVVVAEPRPAPQFAGSDAWTPLTDLDDPRSVEEQVNSRASLVSHARRSVFETPPRNVLVLRTDQLGDVVVSVPALKRLREILPDARIVGLLTSANADLARTLNVFDEVIVVDFPDDREVQRKRVMTIENQEALRARLAPYNFDLALDLAPAPQSRPLLLLSGARFLFGMGDGHWPYLDAGFSFNSHDPVSRTDIMTASSRTLAFIEALGAMMKGPSEIVRRPELRRETLDQFGIGPDDDYIILHTGARIEFSRWAHFDALAARLLGETGYKVVMLSENPDAAADLPASLKENDRFQLVNRRLAFDDFDTLLSYCTVFVGGDSGPKHLASLRGANVVSLHSARVNWGEWGQEHKGLIVHRQVPCGGCLIYHDPEECGQDYVCMKKISLDEVWNAMQEFLVKERQPAAAPPLS